MRTSNFSLPSSLRTTRLLLMLVAIFTAIPTIWMTSALADPAVDAVVLAKEINKSLRAAEGNMFSGKNEIADQQLDAVVPQLEQLKAADPANTNLKSLESKYAQIRKNLDRKLGVTVPKASSTVPGIPPIPKAEAVASMEAAPTATPESGPAALPRAIQSDMANTSAKLDETEATWVEDYTGMRTKRGSTDTNAVKLEAVEPLLRSANYYYGSILEKCQKPSSPCDPNHPDIAALQMRIEAIETNIAGLNAEIESAELANEAAAAEELAQAQAAESECEEWKDRMLVYTEGDKALYRCNSASGADMPRCKDFYDESVALMTEFGASPWATEPCDALDSTLSDLNRYMDNFKSSYESFTEEQATASANLGEIVFSKKTIEPGNPSNLTVQFDAGDQIYGLIQTTKPWSEIYRGNSSAEVLVNVKLDGEKIHAQLVKLKSPELMARQYLVFEIAPDPSDMTAYDDPDREYGSSTATMRQGPNELTHQLAQLSSGQHTMEFDISYYGTVWSAGSFTISGDDFQSYAGMNKQIAEAVSQAVTLPSAQMTNKSMAAEMQSLLENAGWEDIHRINIVDKAWWIDRVNGGDTAEKSRHIAAAALAEDDDGYYYKLCTFYQDKLLTGGFGDLYLSSQGDRVPIPKANIDK